MPGERKEEPNKEKALWVAAGQFSGYGLTWALSVLLFMMGGWWLDQRLGTMPLLMLLGAFLGGAAGFYSLYRHLVVDPRREREREEHEGRDGHDGPEAV